MYRLEIKNYGGRSSQNSRVVRIGCLRIWFSYETPIAFTHSDYQLGRLFIRKNDWSTTTGRHLNFINSDKSIRIDKEQFETHLENVMQLGVISRNNA